MDVPQDWSVAKYQYFAGNVEERGTLDIEGNLTIRFSSIVGPPSSPVLVSRYSAADVQRMGLL